MRIRDWSSDVCSSDLASNSSVLAVVPPTWVIEFSSLDRATARWQSESHSVPLLRLNLPSSAQNERYLLSSLQAIRPAFAQMHLGQPIPIPLLIPKDQQGQPLPRPKEIGRASCRERVCQYV